MKNKQRGFAPIIVAFILLGLITVGGGGYFYLKKQNKPNQELIPNTVSNNQLGQNEAEKQDQLITKRKLEEQLSPPLGFLIPAQMPSNFNLTSSRFTASSTAWYYKDKNKPILVVSIIERTDKNFADEVKRETTSSTQTVRAVKNFSYNGNDGVVLGDFTDPKSYDNFLLYQKSSPGQYLYATGYWLKYDHQGKLLTIYTTDVANISPDSLVSMLKEMTPAK